MERIDRRTFLSRSAGALGAAGAGWAAPWLAAGEPTTTAPACLTSSTTQPAGGFLAGYDTVALGETGIQTSRLAIGTGTKVDHQRQLGREDFVRLLRHGFDRGIRWWDAADMYKTHPLIRAALSELKRDQVVITTKTLSRDAEGVRRDLERFREELGTDYIDIVLLHCLEDPQWPEKMKGPMEVLSEARARGWVRAAGCSCHTFGALEAAANEPWVEVVLARFNPYAVIMDVQTEQEVPRVVEVLRRMKAAGKSIYGMKILGEGQITGEKIDTSLRFALGHDFISGFTIGFVRPAEIDDILVRIERLRVRRA